MSSNFIMLQKEMIEKWDLAQIGVFARLSEWAAYGRFEKTWAGQKIAMTPGQVVFSFRSLAKSLGASVKVVRRALAQLLREGVINMSLIGRGKRKDGSIVTILEAEKRAHGKAHGEVSAGPEQQGFQDDAPFIGHTEGHGLEDRSKEERILTPPLTPHTVFGEEENVVATPFHVEPTTQERELIVLGEVATGVRATERTAQKFIREYRASGHLMTADDIAAGFRLIGSHPHLKASTKAITRVFHMKAVRAAAREFDTWHHNDILECCRRTGDVARAIELYRRGFQKPEDADALILHYQAEFEAGCRVEAFG